ncbi:hypothetical protein DFQ28_005139 [Apophysomyces sp. BC1034]|nr:hypothetical protein DFQ30_000908 [Apophysomyces sp. BC1015]KAG0180245.1 hypothetical protein DFQ29_000979 [Apophysomyces sp. BC1021]KAG0188282.1 hypothetical protein DFQ28_005139 [Apophysomyces sp. BC1034]
MDTLEKYMMHSYNRNVVRAHARQEVRTRQDLFQMNEETGEEELRPDRVAHIPYTIRSSRGYKRKAYLDLHALIRQLGEPQIFFTISCGDFAEDMLRAVGCDVPWDDPVLFADHFRSFLGKWSQRIKALDKRVVVYDNAEQIESLKKLYFRFHPVTADQEDFELMHVPQTDHYMKPYQKALQELAIILQERNSVSGLVTYTIELLQSTN